MLYTICSFSKTRKAWLLLALTACILELIAVYFQHVILLIPCILCIYQRCALYGILITAIIGSLAPSINFIRYLTICLWGYCSWKGLFIAIKHINIQRNYKTTTTTNIINNNFFDNFPYWLKLDEWLPKIFKSYGNCQESQWNFLSLTMSKWMIIIFGTYLLLALIVLISQFFQHRQRDIFKS